MPERAAGRRFSKLELLVLYVVTGCVAVVAGVATALVGLLALSAFRLGCRPAGGDVAPGGASTCPDGTGLVLPAFTFGAVGALAALVAALALVTRWADAPTILHVSRHVMWLAALVGAVPGLTYAGLALTAAATQPGLWGLAAALFCALPLATSYFCPRWTTPVLAVCLVVPLLVVAMGWWLALLVPIAVPLAGLWLITLWLGHEAGRKRSRSKSTPISVA